MIFEPTLNTGSFIRVAIHTRDRIVPWIVHTLAAHVPVITLPGYDARSRFTLGCYRTLNVSEFVARNVKEYVQIAIRAATNITWREEIMSRIDVVKHLLENDKTPIVWNNFLRRVVEQY